jgi:peptidoglycan hydrolase CwlO-like protein
MITLEQIRLLESKITRAIELIRVLKEENSTLRKGLESAQKRMKELESLVDGFKTDQKEIESVIVRTLQHLDDLEEASSARKPDHNGKRQAEGTASPERPAPERSTAERTSQERSAADRSAPERPTSEGPAADRPASESSRKEELDIF